jgi:hypothetical protein
MCHSSSLGIVVSPTRQRLLAPIATVAALGATAIAPSVSGASTYGRLIARSDAAPAAPLEARFVRVRPPITFVLVVTEPTNAPLIFRWSLRCVGISGRESGGASGTATVSGNHWVKRVRANWIKHPTTCSGSVSGSARANSVLARVFVD